MKKCDTCEHMKFHDSGPIKKIDDICFHYCEKEHWEFDEELDFGSNVDIISFGEELSESVDIVDIWSDCKDYRENIITEVINNLIIESIKTGKPPEDLTPFKK